jgi:uncharacterized 2Fe-2S/4Fe-4S cluster protein (DUF4445 family)
VFQIRDVAGRHSLTAKTGELLIDVLTRAGLMSADSPCGRKGICRKCLVKVRAAARGWEDVLACQTPVVSDMEFVASAQDYGDDICLQDSFGTRVQPETALKKTLVDSFAGGMALCWEQCCADAGITAARCEPARVEIVRDVAEYYRTRTPFTVISTDDAILGLEVGDTCREFYGMAFDIGSTTVVGYLLDLRDGRLAATVSSLNPQVKYGADVITRIAFAEREPDGLEKLRGAIVGCVDELVGRAVQKAGIGREAVYDLVFVGNPAMEHFFLGIQPAGLGRAPYQPVLRNSVAFRASQAGVNVNALAEVHWLPAIAGFVGADTVGMIVAHSLTGKDTVTLALDIGTNGEIVLAGGGRLWACSAAAGPAFEGSLMTCGMRAQSGAIDKVWIENGEVYFHVIDGAKPRGLCGSGIVDAIAAMVKAGVVDATGRLATPPEQGHFAGRMVKKDEQAAFLLVPGGQTGDGRDIVISQKDIRDLQLAKAAIAAGAKMLVRQAGLSLQAIERVLLAGAFGLYLSPESIRTIGLIPRSLCDKIVPVGNAAGLGAQNALLSKRVRRLAVEEAQRVTYVELAGKRDFSDVFVDELFFPS